MIVVLLGIGAAVWAVSVRTRPTFAVYDSVPPPSPVAPAERPADSPAQAAVTPAPAASASASARVAQPVRHPGSSRPVGIRADTAPAATSSATDTAAASDTLRHHRSENYGGYSGYGSRERRGSPNAR
jgi:hypothetical protein